LIHLMKTEWVTGKAAYSFPSYWAPGGVARDQRSARAQVSRQIKHVLTAETGRPGAPILIGTLRQANHIVLQRNNGHPDRNLT